MGWEMMISLQKKNGSKKTLDINLVTIKDGAHRWQMRFSALGKGIIVHGIKVLDCIETVVILGHDFLSTFPSVEFDWERGRIRLRSYWKTPDLMVGGGQHVEWVAVARMEECSENNGEGRHFDVNQDLPASQRRRLEEILRWHEKVYARDPKKA